MATNRHVSAEELRGDIESGHIDTVIVAFADHQGRLVGKRTDGEFYLDTVAKDGVENCDYLLAYDLDDTPIPGFRWASYEQGYGDMRGVVDESTIRYLPWHASTAIVLVDLVDIDSGSPVVVSPRRILQEQVARATAAGYVTKMGSEVEFFLFNEDYDTAHRTGYRDLTATSPYVDDYAIVQTSKQDAVLGAMRRGLRGAGLPLEFTKGEAGKGQHEINLGYQTAVEMADVNLLLKAAVKEIAHRNGRSATFMAKPHLDDSGSSCHIHSSLWTADGPTSSLMFDPAEPRHMSELFRWYLGGLLTTARDFTLLFAPNVNSYKRFQPASWAPTAIGWDVDNRTLGFRVVGHEQSMRIESRVPGADVNCYHAFAAMIAGGLLGIVERIEPPEPYHGNGYVADDLPRIPTTFVDAIDLWRNSEVARRCFGDDVHHHVLRHAEFEWETFNRAVTDWERQRYFERI